MRRVARADRQQLAVDRDRAPERVPGGPWARSAPGRAPNRRARPAPDAATRPPHPSPRHAGHDPSPSWEGPGRPATKCSPSPPRKSSCSPWRGPGPTRPRRCGNDRARASDSSRSAGVQTRVQAPSCVRRGAAGPGPCRCAGACWPTQWRPTAPHPVRSPRRGPARRGRGAARTELFISIHCAWAGRQSGATTSMSDPRYERAFIRSSSLLEEGDAPPRATGDQHPCPNRWVRARAAAAPRVLRVLRHTLAPGPARARPPDAGPAPGAEAATRSVGPRSRAAQGWRSSSSGSRRRTGRQQGGRAAPRPRAPRLRQRDRERAGQVSGLDLAQPRTSSTSGGAGPAAARPARRRRRADARDQPAARRRPPGRRRGSRRRGRSRCVRGAWRPRAPSRARSPAPARGRSARACRPTRRSAPSPTFRLPRRWPAAKASGSRASSTQAPAAWRSSTASSVSGASACSNAASSIASRLRIGVEARSRPAARRAAR